MLKLVIALILFYALHSILADNGMKRWAAQHLGLVRWYRLFYSIVSIASLMAVVVLHFQLGYDPFFIPTTGIKIIGIGLLMIGIALSAVSVLRFGALGFLGLREEAETGLVRTGIHGRIRHPIYTGIILASIGWLLLEPATPVLITVLITFVYLPIGIHLEERKLISSFGDEYRRYRSEVPALLPCRSGRKDHHRN